MSDINCKRAVLVEANKPVEVWDYPMAEPGAGEILLKGSLSGICGTDVHLCKGEIPLPGPIVLGHEGIGLVETMGAGVTTDFCRCALVSGRQGLLCPAHPLQPLLLLYDSKRLDQLRERFERIIYARKAVARLHPQRIHPVTREYPVLSHSGRYAFRSGGGLRLRHADHSSGTGEN